MSKCRIRRQDGEGIPYVIGRDEVSPWAECYTHASATACPIPPEQVASGSFSRQAGASAITALFTV